LIGGTSGESEEKIRSVFDSAIANAPSILFIDALDVIAGKKESSTRGMDRRIIAQLFDSIDAINAFNKVTDNNDNSDEGIKPAVIINGQEQSQANMSNLLLAQSSSDNNTSNSNNFSQHKLVILVVATNK
jgi:SpoVK/Ycf46/Vps4 family AAA+-type ATPase